MSTALQPVDLTGAMVGTTGTIDLTQVIGPGGISYALGGQATLRLHNESNCGLRCMFDNSGQSFNLPAGGWSDSYPKSSDNALNFTVLYTLSGPGVTLLLATYYYPGEPIPAITTLGNSPIGGGNVSTNFSQLTNTGNNPLSTLINVQPNDASAPTWSADNSGNLSISGDNGGVLTQLLQLIAGASPEAIVDGVAFSGGGNITLPNNMSIFWKDATGTARLAILGSSGDSVVLRAMAGASGHKILLQDETGTTQLTVVDTSPQVQVANDLSVGGIVDIAGKTAVVSGGGTCTLYQSFGGTGYKKAIVYLNAYRNGNVSAQLLALPTAFTAGATVIVGNIGNSSQWGGFQLLHNTNPVSAEVLTTLASTGGSGTAVTTLYGLSIAHVAGAFDTVAMQSSGVGSAFTGFIIIEGI